MNLLLLITGLRVWSGGPLQAITRVLVAVSVVSVEVQGMAWSGRGTFTGLAMANAGLAALLLLWRWKAPGPDRPVGNQWRAHARVVVPAALALSAVVAVLNNALPLTPADPYHLERVEQIERLGSIAYDPEIGRDDPRRNVLSWIYEFVLVDLGHVPLLGGLLVRNHGLLGLALYIVTSWAVLILLRAPPGWPVLALFIVPVVFHQFVLVKNDLFAALPALLVLAWMVGRLPDAPSREFVWAGWLSGLAVSVKLLSFPLALLLCAAAALHRRQVWPVVLVVAGGAAGAFAGGFVFTLVENARLYGSPIAPLLGITGRPAGVGDSLWSIARFALSLIDLGTWSRAMSPAPIQWGGAYGLPVIWGLAVLIWSRRRSREAAEALWLALAFWLVSATLNVDLATSHRYVIAPGLLLVAVAATLADREDIVPRWLRQAGIAVIALSALQILRSAGLYLSRL